MYGQLEPNGCPFIPIYVETYCLLGKPAISFLGQLGTKAEEAGRKVSKSGFVAAAIWELSVGLCRVTIRCVGHRWACLQGCPDVGSVRELLTPQRGCGNRYQCTDLCCGVGQVLLACVMCGRRRRFVIACVLVLIMIVWILMTSCFPLLLGVINSVVK
jgi:hypothetical protein